MSIYIENGEVFLIANIIGGTATDENGNMASTIARDNTCKTFNELASFLMNTQGQLRELVKYYNLKIDLAVKNNEDTREYEYINSQLASYEHVMKRLQTGLDSTMLLDARLDTPVTNKIMEGLYSIVIDSQTNRDPYLQAVNPTFSVTHETYKNDADHNGSIPIKVSPLGECLRSKFISISPVIAKYSFKNIQEILESSEIDSKKKASILHELRLDPHIKSAFEAKFQGRFELDNDEVLSFLRYNLQIDNLQSKFDQSQLEVDQTDVNLFKEKLSNAWQQCGFSEDAYGKIAPTIDSICDEIQQFIQDDILSSYTDEMLLLRLKDNWKLIFPDDNLFSSILNNSSITPETKADKISFTTQFFLAIANIYAHEKYGYKGNYGKKLEQKPEKREELANIVKLALEKNESVEDAIIKFIHNIEYSGPFNIFGSLFNLRFNTEDIAKIKERFKIEYRTIESADHFDEFFFCPKTGPYFGYGGSISCEISHLIDLINAYNPQKLELGDKTSFIAEKKAAFRGKSIKFKSLNKLQKMVDIKNELKAGNHLDLALKYFPQDKDFILDLIDSITNLQPNILNLAIRNPYISLDIITKMLDKGARLDPENDEHAIFTAIKNQRHDILDLFQKRDISFDITDIYGNTPLMVSIGYQPKHISIFSNNTDEIIALILQSSTNINNVNIHGQTAVDIAISSGKTTLIPQLITAGIDPKRIDEDGNSYIHKILLTGQNLDHEIYEKIKLDIYKKNKMGKSILDITLERSVDIEHKNYNLDNLNVLFSIAPDLEKIDLKKYACAVTIWALYKEPCPIDETLVISSISSQDEKDFILYLAVESNNYRIVEAILENGANPNINGPYNAPLIYFALNNGDERIISALIEKGNLTAKEKSQVLYFALNERIYYLQEKILAKGNCFDGPYEINGDIPLHLAAIYYDVDFFKGILENTYNINHKNDSGLSTLFYILLSNCQHKAEKIELLLARRGIDLSYEKDGNNIFHMIAKDRNLEISKATLEKIAESQDINKANALGKKPSEIAIENGNTLFLENTNGLISTNRYVRQ